MQICTLDLWILRFAQYDKARWYDKDFEILHFATQSSVWQEKSQYDKIYGAKSAWYDKTSQYDKF